MKVSLIIESLLLIGILGCASTNENNEEQRTGASEQNVDLQKIYVAGIKMLPGDPSKNEVNFVISGNFPNPAYSLDYIDVEVKGFEIFLTPYATYRRDVMAVQVLTPFQATTAVRVEKKGTYKVNIIGRSETITKEFELP